MQEVQSYNVNIVLFFRPQKLGVLFMAPQINSDATFHFSSTFAFLIQEKHDRERFRCLKIDFRSSS